MKEKENNMSKFVEVKLDNGQTFDFSKEVYDELKFNLKLVRVGLENMSEEAKTLMAIVHAEEDPNQISCSIDVLFEGLTPEEDNSKWGKLYWDIDPFISIDVGSNIDFRS